MGTPEFAVSSLKALIDHNYQVVGIVTVPDRPAGRGKKLTPSAVKEFALHADIPILQPLNLKDEQFKNDLAKWKADIQVVVAFRMLPQTVWDMPKLGTFNLHASLLPQYRGAAPINHALINGETITGATTFFLDHQIDTGNILMQQTVDILPADNAETLHNKLKEIGADLVVKTMEAILSCKVIAKPQKEIVSPESLKTAPKISKAFCKINWNQSGENIHNFVRGLSPYPAATSEIYKYNKEIISVKIFNTKFIPQIHEFEHGAIHIRDKKTMLVAVMDGFIQVNIIQQAGKKALKTEEFLKGMGDLNESSFQ